MSASRTEERGRKQITKELQFPACEFCVSHRGTKGFFGTALPSGTHPREQCCGRGIIVELKDWEATDFTFWFENPYYAHLFAEANRAARKTVLMAEGLSGVPLAPLSERFPPTPQPHQPTEVHVGDDPNVSFGKLVRSLAWFVVVFAVGMIVLLLGSKGFQRRNEAENPPRTAPGLSVLPAQPLDGGMLPDAHRPPATHHGGARR